MRRGGCWNLHAAYCRSACRLQIEPTASNHDLGFRIILEQHAGLMPANDRSETVRPA